MGPIVPEGLAVRLSGPDGDELPEGRTAELFQCDVTGLKRG